MAFFLLAGTTGASPRDGSSLAKVTSSCSGKFDCPAAPLVPPTTATARLRRVLRWHLHVSPEESACPLPCRKRTPADGPEHFGKAVEFAKRLRPSQSRPDRED